MTIDLHRRLPERPEPECRYTVRGTGPQYRVWDAKWEMYLTTADVSLRPDEAEAICKILNNRDQLGAADPEPMSKSLARRITAQGGDKSVCAHDFQAPFDGVEVKLYEVCQKCGERRR